MKNNDWKITFNLSYCELPEDKIVLIAGNKYERLISNYIVVEFTDSLHGKKLISVDNWKRVFKYCSEHGVELLGVIQKADNPNFFDQSLLFGLSALVVIYVNKNNEISISEINLDNCEHQILKATSGEIDEKESNNQIAFRLLIAMACCLTLIFAILYPVMRKIEQPGNVAYHQLSDTKTSNDTNKKKNTIVNKIKLSDSQQDYILYTVKKGDSLWKISEQYYGSGLNFVQIMKDNHVINPASIKIGTVLKIKITRTEDEVTPVK